MNQHLRTGQTDASSSVMERNISGRPILGSLSPSLLSLFVKRQILKKLWLGEGGQDLVEFALVIALISLGATASMSTVATAIGTAFNSVGTKFGGYFS
jgi:pilus assembly protein Flp/PilA